MMSNKGGFTIQKILDQARLPDDTSHLIGKGNKSKSIEKGDEKAVEKATREVRY